MNKTLIIDRIADVFIYLIITLVCIITMYPFIYCMAYSFSDSVLVTINNIVFFPVGFTFENYKIVFRNDFILNSFFITVSRTVLGTLYTLMITALAAYAISKKKLPGNRVISIFLIIPMYVSGGLIPYYVLINKLHLFNNFLVYIIPYGFYAYNMLVMRTFFDSIPASFEESAKLDGATDLKIFFRIILPLSMPIIATIGLFVGVFQWNAWWDSLLYTTSMKLMPLQRFLQKLIDENMANDLARTSLTAYRTKNTSPESIKMATLIVSTVPIVCVYPFLQKYFVKGVMIGGVKA